MMQIMPNLYEATTLAELMDILKSEQGDSDAGLAKKMGLSPNTVNRVRRGFRADDATLDKIADHIGVSRDWVYGLAKGISARPKHPRPVSMLVS
jgi:transcriptional regulator with XRE-family HTH domain